MDKTTILGKLDKVRKFIDLTEDEMSKSIGISTVDYRNINDGKKLLTIVQVILIHRLVRAKTDQLLT